jgi:hypothetical protein
MKKLIFLPLLILSLTLSGQFTKSGGTFLKSSNIFLTAPAEPPVDLYCDEYDAILAAMTNQPSEAVAEAQNTMVEALIAGGYWARMDQLLVFATYTNAASEALINWIDPGTNDATLTALAAGAFAQYDGITGDGIDGWINTNFNPSTADATNFTQNSGSFGVWFGIGNLTETGITAGCYATNRIQIAPSLNGYVEVAINNGGDDTFFIENTNTSGLFVASRTSSSTLSAYRNGTLLGTNSSSTSTAIPNENIGILAVGGIEDSFSVNMVRISYIMNATANATEADAIYDIFLAYLNTIDAL